MAYSAADVYVIPSLMDNLPNTVLESLMCGTPVIGFPVGGITDMVEHGVNGLLSKDISVTSLLEILKQFLTGKKVFDRTSIRNNALKNYALKVQADKYLELYHEIVERGT
jgi:glycosyltransferase involved in cell wall biosynthesis